MAFTGCAALFAAIGTETAITAVMVLTAVAEVGTAMTVVGMVTGDKELTKWGGVLGIVGGVGSWAAGALSEGATATALTTEQVTAEGLMPNVAGDTAGLGGMADKALPPDVAVNTGMTTAPTPASAATGPMTVAAPPTEGFKDIAGDAPNSAAPSQIGGSGGGGGSTGVQKTLDSTTSAYTKAGAETSSPYSTNYGKYIDKTDTGNVGGFWSSLDPRVQQTLIGTAGAAFGGLSQAHQQDIANQIAQQRVTQSSYGSAVPKGVIASAKV